MEYPNDSINGLCAAASTAFALGIAFLGAWGFQGQGHWRAVDLLVVVPMSLASAGFGFTPLVATRPVKAPVRGARIFYGTSVVLAMTSVLFALIIEYGK